MSDDAQRPLAPPEPEVFQRLLELMRQTRASSTVLVREDHEPGRWAEVETVRGLCHRLTSSLHADFEGLDDVLPRSLERFVHLIETALTELTLSAALGPEDHFGVSARGRAHRGIEEEAARLERAILRQMARRVASPLT